MYIHPNTPILIGVGQCMSRWNGDDIETAPSPQSLRLQAAEAALADSGAGEALRTAIDQIIVVRTMMDSVPQLTQPFGRCANPPATLADGIGAKPTRSIYSVVGGDQPQTLVNEAAESIFDGEASVILIAGSEATAAMKLALRKGLTLNWSGSAAGECEDRGLGMRLLSDYEIANGLGSPTQTYPAFEHALRARLGHSREQHTEIMSELWSGFSQVAAANPYAQFPEARTPAYLATPSPENYPVADPYLKWHVAQDAVNQGAAVILTSVSKAQALGIDPAKWIYLHGYAQAADKPVTEREDISRSVAMELTLKQALEGARKTPTDVNHFDLYSCFPCAVLLSCEALGLDWRTTALTVTGGLPFFGGAGNNYSMHAIATMVERLRSARDDYGLVLANGGFLSKEAVGVYSAQPKEGWTPISSDAIKAEIAALPSPQLLNENCDVVIETYTVTFTKGIAQRAYILGRNGGNRILARVRNDDQATLSALQSCDPIGRLVTVERDGGVNYFVLN
jgi:acetyl-CoA C-acetyltransferase